MPNLPNEDMRTVTWSGDAVRLIDQTQLPNEVVFLDLRDYRDVAAAIRLMQVRGAPAIGVAAAYGAALAAHEAEALPADERARFVGAALDALATTRPTAVNLFWAIERIRRLLDRVGVGDGFSGDVLREARAVESEDEAMCRQIGRFGAELIPDGANVLTHCNAGGLATAGYGTAIGVIRAAVEQGKRIHVYVDETRPLLQGARLTAWELTQSGIPMTLITDNMAGYLMRLGRIDCAVVGADRIAANGDVANKIGTYSVAVLAKEHRLPFYVAAPSSTVDVSLPSGEQIPIEERTPDEVTSFGLRRTAPPDVLVFNPAFDVTPARLVSAIVTEAGVLRAPYEESLRRLKARAGLEQVSHG